MSNRRVFLKECSQAVQATLALAAGGGLWPGLLRSRLAFADSAAPAPRPGTQNRFLLGNYAPLPIDDERDVADLPVIGKIPDSLHGTYVRNGPNPIHPPMPYHWFDGDGMLHAVRLEGGKARYVNRFVRTEGWLKEKEAGKCLYGGLIAGSPNKNAANTSVVWHHGKLLAAWEGGLPYAVDPKTLETQGQYDFGGKLKNAFTAHPKIDPVTGELIFFWYGEKVPHLTYGVLDPAGKLAHLAPLQLPRYVLVHDFAITQRHAVFLDLPLLFTPHGLKYDPALPSRIGVLPRRGTAADLRWFEIKPCWVWHTLNAYESGDEVTLIAARHPDFPRSPSYLYRWSLNLKTGAVSEGPLDDRKIEFPQVSPGLLGSESRYGYAGLGDPATPPEEFIGVVKYDLKNGSSSIFSFGKDRHGGETIFAPAGGPSLGTTEDRGFLLNLVFDKGTGKSELVILAADGEPSAPPVARVLLPRNVPYGLHGTWIPA